MISTKLIKRERAWNARTRLIKRRELGMISTRLIKPERAWNDKYKTYQIERGSIETYKTYQTGESPES